MENRPISQPAFCCFSRVTFLAKKAKPSCRASLSFKEFTGLNMAHKGEEKTKCRRAEQFIQIQRDNG